MHASDTIINLVADGYALDPQPWMRNDLILVGPPEDPAGIKGMTDAPEALKKIALAKAPFVVHASLGAQEVLHELCRIAGVDLDPMTTTILLEDRQRQVLKFAAEKKAYTLIGRIPFRTGKLPSNGMVLMVQGDDRMRRPYVVAVASPDRIAGARYNAARKLAAFLRSPATQDWIAGFGRGKIDDLPLFFPVVLQRPATRPAGTLLDVAGEAPHPETYVAGTWKQLPHEIVEVTGRDGKPARYDGVPLRRLLIRAGAAPDTPHLDHAAAPFAVVVEAADGFRATFSLAELEREPEGQATLIADARDGDPLSPTEGPLRLIVPTDSRPVRWAKQVVLVTVIKP